MKFKKIFANILICNFCFVNFAFAQTEFKLPSEVSKFNNLSQCEKGSNAPIKDFAKNLRDSAMIEWGYLGKQTIDETGKIVAFGGNEGESDIDVAGFAEFSKEVPWFNVLRYWKILQSIGGFENFRNTNYQIDDFLLPNSKTGNGGRGKNGFDTKINPIIEKFKTFENLSDKEKKVIENALLRAAIIDMPWSGAFISAMHAIAFEKTFQKPPNEFNFQYSGRHSVYIKDGFLTASQEISNSLIQTYSYYRACNAATTSPRIGDMYCYVRLGTGAKFKEYDISQSFDMAAYLYFNDGDKNLRNTHCDIIVNIDKNAHFVDVIGGNVYQSVSLKRLWLNENNLLSLSIYDNTQTDAAAKAKLCRKNNCNLNAKPWFVLLQARE